jgi:hypothetical protein
MIEGLELLRQALADLDQATKERKLAEAMLANWFMDSETILGRSARREVQRTRAVEELRERDLMKVLEQLRFTWPARD